MKYLHWRGRSGRSGNCMLQPSLCCKSALVPSPATMTSFRVVNAPALLSTWSLPYCCRIWPTSTRSCMRTEAFTRDTLRQRFPQFEADLGRLDVEAGFHIQASQIGLE